MFCLSPRFLSNFDHFLDDLTVYFYKVNTTGDVGWFYCLSHNVEDFALFAFR
jgi:hypothetical protein